MFGGPPSEGKKITYPTRGQASPALRPQKYGRSTTAPEFYLVLQHRNQKLAGAAGLVKAYL
ncbi:hypothetical protein N7536_006774 [Penicillium majusculum]|nr:hypothetical protein N7536_006774 [Penicillium majusculum]